MADIYDNVIELARRRGFVWPSSECYGAVAGFIDYGPLGAMLKRKIENLWRNFYIIQEGYYEIEAPTIGVESIYIASGHVKGFADKMCQCPHCREYHRADHIAEEHGTPGADALRIEGLKDCIANLPCPSCGESMGEVEVPEHSAPDTCAPRPHREYLPISTVCHVFTGKNFHSVQFRLENPTAMKYPPGRA